MKKLGSQIMVAVVCCILGFMIAYQFKTLTKYGEKSNINNANSNNSDITADIEIYKKDKIDMQKRVDELQSQVKKYESAAVNKSDINKEIIDELENTRMVTGATDVEGPGIIIRLTPVSNIFGTNAPKEITSEHLTYLVNELRFAGAEAIAINDYRITSRTGISSSRGNSFILINGADQKISPKDTIVVTAIGNKDLLSKDLNFPTALDEFKGISGVNIDKADNIKIPKSTKIIKFEYAKPTK
jgi:uncharacterized protein YlxW (UPF0749 family)